MSFFLLKKNNLFSKACTSVLFIWIIFCVDRFQSKHATELVSLLLSSLICIEYPSIHPVLQG